MSMFSRRRKKGGRITDKFNTGNRLSAAKSISLSCCFIGDTFQKTTRIEYLVMFTALINWIADVSSPVEATGQISKRTCSNTSLQHLFSMISDYPNNIRFESEIIDVQQVPNETVSSFWRNLL